MVRRIGTGCANCKHLIIKYLQQGGDTWHYCPIMKGYIRIRETWTENCVNWEVKQ